MKKLLVPALLAVLAVGVSSLQAKDAKENYTTLRCGVCHGKEGKGDTKVGQKLNCKDYSDPKVQEKAKDEEMFKVIKEGLKKGDTTIMAAYGDKLTDAEIKDMVKFFRAFAPKK